MQAVSNDEAWLKTLAALQQDGLTGANLARAVTMLAAPAGGLVVYLDDAESLQTKPEAEGDCGAGVPPASGADGTPATQPDRSLGRWQDDELRSFWTSLIAASADGGPLALVASSRYRPEGTPERAVLPLEPMSHWEIVRLMTWMPTLRRLPHEDRAWLADRVEVATTSRGGQDILVSIILGALAEVLMTKGDLAGAREKLERVLEIEAKVYGTRNHYMTAITESNLGFLLLELDEKEAGVELLAHAYAVFQRQLGPEHPYTRNLASLFEKKDE